MCCNDDDYDDYDDEWWDDEKEEGDFDADELGLDPEREDDEDDPRG